MPPKDLNHFLFKYLASALMLTGIEKKLFILYQIHCPNRCFLSTSSSPLIFPPLSLPVAEEPLESGQMHFVKVAMQSSPLQAESG